MSEVWVRGLCAFLILGENVCVYQFNWLLRQCLLDCGVCLRGL
jgi:hypothetical protein